MWQHVLVTNSFIPPGATVDNVLHYIKLSLPGIWQNLTVFVLNNDVAFGDHITQHNNNIIAIWKSSYHQKNMSSFIFIFNLINHHRKFLFLCKQCFILCFDIIQRCSHAVPLDTRPYYFFSSFLCIHCVETNEYIWAWSLCHVASCGPLNLTLSALWDTVDCNLYKLTLWH